jgi:hypothetical protein
MTMQIGCAVQVYGSAMPLESLHPGRLTKVLAQRAASSVDRRL